MLFKSMDLFKVELSEKLNQTAFEQYIEPLRFKPCGPHTPETVGFISPLGEHHKGLSHVVGSCFMFCLQFEEKVLPKGTVKRRVQERIVKMEEEMGGRIDRAERQKIEEDVINEMLPNAFSEFKTLMGYIDQSNNHLVVNGGSKKQLEKVLSMLGKAMGEKIKIIEALPTAILDVVMTLWMKKSEPLPENFSIESDCVLKEQGGKGKITCKEQPLESDEIQAHLESGMLVEKIKLNFDDKFEMTLKDDFKIRGIKAGETFEEEMDNIEVESLEELFDAKFALTTDYISEALDPLYKNIESLVERI